MAKDEGWLTVLGIAAGGALLVLLLNELAKNKGSYYKCPRCNYPVSKGVGACSNCGQPLTWGEK